MLKLQSGQLKGNDVMLTPEILGTTHTFRRCNTVSNTFLMENAPNEKNGLQDKWPSEEKINLCQGYCKQF